METNGHGCPLLKSRLKTVNTTSGQNTWASQTSVGVIWVIFKEFKARIKIHFWETLHTKEIAEIQSAWPLYGFARQEKYSLSSNSKKQNDKKMPCSSPNTKFITFPVDGFLLITLLHSTQTFRRRTPKLEIHEDQQNLTLCPLHYFVTS